MLTKFSIVMNIDVSVRIKIRYCLLVALIGLIYDVGYTQKVERERRCRLDLFPEKALQYLQEQFPQQSRTRYFEEFSNDGRTFEAKFKRDGRKYSVEFFEDGSLMDIEEKIQKSELASSVFKQIVHTWNQDFRRFKIIKIQRQTGNGATKYEIEIKGWEGRSRKIFQYLFDVQGHFLSREEIIEPTNEFSFY